MDFLIFIGQEKHVENVFPIFFSFLPGTRNLKWQLTTLGTSTESTLRTIELGSQWEALKIFYVNHCTASLKQGFKLPNILEMSNWWTKCMKVSENTKLMGRYTGYSCILHSSESTACLLEFETLENWLLYLLRRFCFRSLISSNSSNLCQFYHFRNKEKWCFHSSWSNPQVIFWICNFMFYTFFPLAYKSVWNC